MNTSNPGMGGAIVRDTATPYEVPADYTNRMILGASAFVLRGLTEKPTPIPGAIVFWILNTTATSQAVVPPGTTFPFELRGVLPDGSEVVFVPIEAPAAP